MTDHNYPSSQDESDSVLAPLHWPTAKKLGTWKFLLTGPNAVAATVSGVSVYYRPFLDWMPAWALPTLAVGYVILRSPWAETAQERIRKYEDASRALQERADAHLESSAKISTLNSTSVDLKAQIVASNIERDDLQGTLDALAPLIKQFHIYSISRALHLRDGSHVLLLNNYTPSLLYEDCLIAMDPDSFRVAGQFRSVQSTESRPYVVPVTINDPIWWNHMKDAAETKEIVESHIRLFRVLRGGELG